MKTLITFIILSLFLTFTIGEDVFAQEIPSWIKNNAAWWAEGQIDDTAFLQGISFLIKEGIMVIPPTEASTSSESKEVPGWIKNNAEWWADGQIDDGTFVSGIQFLVKNGIIVVEQDTPSKSLAEKLPKTYDVIIIGAGMSGMAAADHLDEKGHSVLVLEARDRVGGRTWTVYWDDAETYVDLGASWIHGSNPDNPITKIAEDYGIELLETDLNNGVLLGQDGQWIDDEAYAEIESLYQEFEEYRWVYADTVDQDGSVADAEEKFTQIKNLTEKQKNQLRFYIHTALSHEEAADASDLSLWTDPGKALIGQEMLFPKGYAQIINTLDDGLDIRLEHVVSKVEYNDDGVTVTTNQGIFDSQYVISTLPIGVLKSNSVEFSPSLPAAKQQAIDRIGMGLLNKLYLLFDDVFWDDVTLLNYVSPDGSPMWEFFNLSDLGKPILLGFTTGQHAHEFEKLSDEEIIEDAMNVLKVMYGDEILEPRDYIRTKWASDSFAFGSYSYAGVGVTESDYEALAEPVMNRVFFAGEATYIDYLATVHGAYLSGIRAAEQISQLN